MTDSATSDSPVRPSEAADRAEPPLNGRAGRQHRLAYLSALVGTTIEYYDFILYGLAASLVFAPVFFAGASPTLGVVASFATLAAGYLVRPLGGLVVAHFGDRFGRKTPMLVTLTIMGTTSTLIGLLPGSAQIGVAAPILLLLLRLLQGFAVGGEWGGSVTLSIEHSRPGRRGLASSAAQTGGALGAVLAFAVFGVVATLPSEVLLGWGWRVPFLASALLLVFCLVIRVKLEESPVLLEAQRSGADTPRDAPVVEVLRTQWRRVLLAVGLFLGPCVMQAVISTYGITYATTMAGVPSSTMITILMVVSAGIALAVPLAGRLSDRFGRRVVFGVGVVGMIPMCFALFPALGSGNAATILAVYLVQLVVFYGGVNGTISAILAELFPTRTRYTGVTLSFQVASAIGGAGPLAAAALVAGGAGPLLLGSLMAVGCVLSLVCVLVLPETRTVDLVQVDRP